MLTETQKELVDMVEHFISSDTGADDKQSAFRDLLTDLRHVADHLEVDFNFALDGSYEVYLQEKGENNAR